MKKSAVAVAVTSALGGVSAQADVVPVILIDTVAASMGATSVVLLGATTATWSYDTVTGVVTGSGFLQHQSQANPALPGSIFTRNFVDLSWGGGGTAGATSFDCIDGSFSPLVGASFCGNYNFGANSLNESTNSWGPGLAFSQTIGGDDVSLGPQQSIAGYDGATTTPGGPVIPGDPPLPPETIVVSNMDVGLTTGQAYTYVRPGDAVDDDPGGVPGYAVLFGSSGNVLDIGANDAFWPAPAAGNQDVTGPATGDQGGSFTITSDPDITLVTVSYTPQPAFVGTETWTYTVTDTSGGVWDGWMDTATVTVDVTGTGAGNDMGTTTRLREAIVIPTGQNDLGFTDPATVIIETPPMMGDVVVNGSPGVATDITITYTSTAPLGTPGPLNDSFVYRITDSAMVTDTATVSVTVNNTLPVANDLGGVTLDTQGQSPADVSTTINVGDGGDIPGNSLGDTPATVTTMMANDVTATVNGSNITITAAAFTSAGDALGYTIADADTETDTGTITVAIPDVTPTVQDGADTVELGDTMTIAVATVPGNGAPADHSITVSQPQFGVVSNVAVNGTGTQVTFDYEATAIGVDTLTVQLTDGDGSTGEGTVTVTIPDRVPQLEDAAATVNVGNSATVTLAAQLGNGAVSDHSVSVSPAQFGTVSNEALSADGSAVTFDYQATAQGVDSLTVELTDLDGSVGTGTATVTVPDRVPQVQDVSTSIDVPGGVEVAVPVQLGDGSADQHTPTVSGASWGEVSNVALDAAGTEITFVYNPTGFAATDTLTVQLTDADGDAASGTATLTITGSAVTVEQQNSLPGNSSALGPLSLGGLLVGIPLLRSRRRKDRK